MEMDNEAKGNGNSYTTEFRQYDPRLGRWLSLDPMASERPSYNPYNYCRNNPIIMTDPSGLQDDWYEDAEGNVEYKENTEASLYDDNYKLWKNIGKQLNDADISRIGVGKEFEVFKLAANDYKHWTTPWAFTNAGKNVPTITAPMVPQYYHPMMNSKGFIQDRITSNSSMFVTNESINSENFADAIIGAMIGGQGPENFYFAPGSSVSNSMFRSQIVQDAINKFKGINREFSSRGEIYPLEWDHYSQLKGRAIFSAYRRIFNLQSNPATPENVIGGAAIKITPLKMISSDEVLVRITIFNVTSVGSGSVDQSGGAGDQSFPRPLGESSPQPYTNIGQVIELDVRIKLR